MAEGESENGGFSWKEFLPSWLRRGRVADVTNIQVQKLADAAKRGVTIEIQTSVPGKVTARVDKVVVKGNDQTDQ